MAYKDCSVTKSDWYRMYIEYSISTNNSTKKSTISHSLKLEQLTNSYDFNGRMNVKYYVNGEEFSYNGNINIDDKGNAGYTITITSGTTTVSHDSTTGDASFDISCSGSCPSGGWGPGDISLSSKTIKIDRIPLYTLSVSAGSGSSITVNRTSSVGGGGTGNISSGTSLYYGDTLKITFTASANYSVTTHTVNGDDFSSGGTKTVKGNISVVSKATPLKSKIGATDANIGSTSTITVTRYNSSYTHTITYKLGNATGTILTKGTSTSIPWTIPTDFYAQIPNSKTGSCTLTIETFNGNSSLGSGTCTLTVTAPASTCTPDITGSIIDINSTTKTLTGDDSVLIRYKSTAQCTLTATPKNYASISSTKIGGSTVTGTSSGGIVTATKNYSDVSDTSFLFETKDSRGYSKSQTVTPTVISYIKLTINPILTRPAPTSNEVLMTFSGNYYRGSFGEYSNTLTVQYRYKELGGAAYGSWNTISSTDILYGNGTFRTNAAVSLGENFDYHNSYEFEVRAYDGANGLTLSTDKKDAVVKRGIPVFDWGENDFNFHVPVKIGDTTITEQQLQQLLALIT